MEDVPSFNTKLLVYNYGKLLKNCMLVVKVLLNSTSQNFCTICVKSTRSYSENNGNKKKTKLIRCFIDVQVQSKNFDVMGYSSKTLKFLSDKNYEFCKNLQNDFSNLSATCQ